MTKDQARGHGHPQPAQRAVRADPVDEGAGRGAGRLRATGTVVEVDHPTRGSYLTVGNPIKMSDSPSEVVRSPLLGEHTDEILSEVLGLNDGDIADAKASGAVGDEIQNIAAE